MLRTSDPQSRRSWNDRLSTIGGVVGAVCLVVAVVVILLLVLALVAFAVCATGDADCLRFG